MKHGCFLREQALLKQIEHKSSYPLVINDKVAIEVKALNSEPSHPDLATSSVETEQECVEDTVKHLTEKLEAWQSNVMTYIGVKESCRNTISIVFEKDEVNLQMVNNEHIIKLYVSKIFKLP